MTNPESRIGWLRNSPGDNNPVDLTDTTIFTDTYTGKTVNVTPEQLKQINDNDPILKLMVWGGFKTIEEAEAFLAESE